MARFFDSIRAFRSFLRRDKVNELRRSKSRRAQLMMEPLDERVVPAVIATLDDQTSTPVAPGGTINYLVSVNNNGATTVNNVQFDVNLDGNAPLVPGTIKIGPHARRDVYNAVGNTQLLGDLRANDYDVDGLTANASLVVTAINGVAVNVGNATTLPSGGNVTVFANGTFSYIPQTGDQNLTDTFTYSITDGDGLVGTGQVVFNLGQRVWYVDSTYAGANGTEDGSSLKPYNAVSDITGSAGSDADNDIIFIREQAGDYNGFLTLLNGQRLYGGGSTLVVNGVTIHNGTGGHTTMRATAAGTSAIILAQNNELRGVALDGPASGNGIFGNNFGNLLVSNVSVNTGGTALNLANGTFAAGSVFANVSSSGGGNNILLANVGGTVDLGGGALSGATNHGFFVQGGSVFATYSGSISQSSGGNTVYVTGGHNAILTFRTGNITSSGGGGLSFSNADGAYIFNGLTTVSGTAGIGIANGSSGTFTFGTNTSINNSSATAGYSETDSTANVNYNGTITDPNATGLVVNIVNKTGGSTVFRGQITGNTGIGGGVFLSNNSGGNIAFTGGVNLTTTSGNTFQATGGGTVIVTGANNFLQSTTGVALAITSTTIGSSGLTFRSISSNGATNGIVLSNTGSSGGLTVTGDGGASNNSSGGTIQNSSGVGVLLNSTRNVSLNYLHVTNSGNDGISGTQVTNFSMNRGCVTNNGDALNEDGLDFGGSGVVTPAPNGLFGTVTITNAIFTGNYYNQFTIRNSGNSTNVTMTNSTVSGRVAENNNNDGILLESLGSSNITANIQNSTFSANKGDHFQAAATDNGDLNIIFANNTLTGGHSSPLGQGITINAALGIMFGGYTGCVTYDVANNTINGSILSAITIAQGSSATEARFTGKVRNNVIGTSGVANSASSQGHGIYIDARGNGTQTTLVHNNVIRQAFDRGIQAEAGDGNPVLNLTVTSNIIDQQVGAGTREAFQTNFGITSTNVFGEVDTPIVSLTLGGPGALANTFSHGGGAPDDFRLRKRFEAVVMLPGYAGGTGNDATSLGQVVAFIQGQNTGSAGEPGSAAASGAGGGYTNGPATPQPPLLFAPWASEASAPLSETLSPQAPPSAPNEPEANPAAPVSPPPVLLGPTASVDSIIESAIARWTAAGLTSEQIALLRSVTISFENLPGLYLGSAGAGHITLDTDAAGYGWFLDATPQSDEEYFAENATRLDAINNGPANGKLDLLTTVMHELGHQLGLDDIYDRSFYTNLMYGFLHLGERRLPAFGQADRAVPHVHEGLDFLTSPVFIGDLDANSTVQIAFQVQVVASPTTRSITNQGNVTFAGGPGGGVPTDDPATGAANDATVTAIDLPDVTVAVSPTSILEDASGNLVYTFSRTGPTTNPLTINFNVGGNASFGAGDYTQTGAATFGNTTGTLTFGAGNSTATITIDPTADTTVEGDELVMLTVAAGTGYDAPGDATYGNASIGNATATITNDDTDVSVVVLGSSEIDEDTAGNITYRFTRTGNTTAAITVNFTVSGNATLANSDYTPSGAATLTDSNGTVTFGPGVTTANVTIDPTADTTVEGNETLTFTVANGTGYNATGSPATSIIYNDDTDITLSVSPASVTEDGSGNLVYTFTRAGVLGIARTVNFTVGGNAAFGSDYSQSGAGNFTLTSGNVTFGAGSSTATITIDPTADTTAENDEIVTLTLANGTGYNVATPTAVTGTIVNDDTNISVNVAPASVLEDSGNTLVYTFTRTGLTAGSLTVDFTVGGSAIQANNDYTHSGANSFSDAFGNVVFGANVTQVQVIVTPTTDFALELDESLTLTVVNGTGYTAVGNAATGTIINEDSEVFVTISGGPSSLAEDSGGSITYRFTRFGNTSIPLDVSFLVSGTATLANSDYTHSSLITYSDTSGTVGFTSGNSVVDVTITPTADTTVEGNETLTFTLANGTGYTATGSPATGTILNDDTDVTLSVSPASVAEDGSGNLTYTFTRTGVLGTALTVNFNVSGNATHGSDYTQTGAGSFSNTTGNITFGVGNTTATITIDPTADTDAENDEIVTLTLANGTGYNIASPSTATGTIADDDTKIALTLIGNSTAGEDGLSTLTYRFTLIGNITAPLTANFTAGGLALANTDYTASNATFAGNTGSVVFNVGVSTIDVTVTATEDRLVEGNESVIFTLVSGSGYGLDANNTASATLTDNDTATVGYDSTSATVPEAVGSGNIGLVLTINAVGNGTLGLGSDLKIDLTSTGGTATGNGTDYTLPGTVTFAAGTYANATTVQYATGSVTSDKLVEGNETGNLGLSIVQNIGNQASLAGNTAFALDITDDDDATIDFSISNSTVSEGSGSGVIGVKLTINAIGDANATPGLASAVSADITGTTGGDFTLPGSPAVTFAAGNYASGNSTQFGGIALIDDRTVEGNETKLLSLSLANGIGSQVTLGNQTTHNLTLTDNDTVTIGFANATGSVGEASGNASVDVVLTINATGTGNIALASSIEVDITSTGGTATDGGTDYSLPATVVFPTGIYANSTTATAILPITSDKLVEGNETADLGLSISQNIGTQATLAGGSTNFALGITDDDTASITFAAANSSVSEGSGNATVGITLTINAIGDANATPGLASNITVDFTTTGGSATGNGTDYTLPTSPAVTFSTAGTQNASVALTGDRLAEGSEIANLGLSLVTGLGNQVALSGSPTHALTITDDDFALIAFANTSIILGEAAGNTTLGVTLTINANGSVGPAELAQPITVNVNDLLTGTANLTQDYNFTSPQTVNFASGSANQTASVPLQIVQDLFGEGNETVNFNLSGVSDGTGQALLSLLTSTVTILDDDVATLGGRAFLDLDGDGNLDAGENGISGLTVYLDLNNNAVPDGNEPSSVTDANGTYFLGNTIIAGNYTVRQVLIGAQALTANFATGSSNITLLGGDNITLNIGNRNNSGIQPLATTPQLFTAGSLSANESFVRNLYRSVLGREGDTPGVNHWTNQLNIGTAKQTVIDGFIKSTEYYGNLVSSYYQLFLGRAVDSTGLAFWVNKFVTGWTAESVIIGIMTSVEATTRFDSATFVGILYRNFLGRIPSAGEVNGWVGALNSNFLNRTQVIQQLMRSTESSGRFVDSLYNHFVHRIGDATGRAALVNGYMSGVNAIVLINSFLNSAEFFNKSAAAV